MLPFLTRIASALTVFSQLYIPSAFAIAVLLTFLTFGAAMVGVGASPARVVVEWGKGFWTLIPFAMQMALVVLTGFLVSTTPLVDRLFVALASRPRTPRGTVVLMAAVSMALAWVHWGLSLVGCAMLVRHMARRQPLVDYRLLVCAAYLGMGATWHAGLSASAPLLVATPGHFLEAEIGVISVTRTIFHPFNLGLTAIVVMLLLALMAILHPPAEQATTIAPDALEALERFDVPAKPAERTFAAWIDHTRLLTCAIGICGVAWLIWHFATAGLVLTLDVLNFAFLMLAILLHPNAASLLHATEQGARLLGGIVLQFPFYAGMFGVIQGTGLAEALGRWIASAAGPRSYPLLLYWYSGLVNYFVPSGGSKWAIEAPYLIDAAARLGVGVDRVVVAYAWGDMATDLIQPFWALPLLAAARLDFKDIMGYAMLVFLVYSSVVSIAFALMPVLW